MEAKPKLEVVPHPYASASRSTHVKAEPRSDEEIAQALYGRAEPHSLAMLRIKKEEDMYP